MAVNNMKDLVEKIYIDVRFSFSVSKISGKFNGGNNYVISVLNLIKEKSDHNTEIFLICNLSTANDLKDTLGIADINYIEIKNLSELFLTNHDVLFIPQVNDSKQYAKELIKFRKKNADCKIYITIHDRRHKDLIYDKYASILKFGLKSNNAVLAIGRKWNAIKIDRYLKRIIRITDKVFTVSNYSMQRLIEFKKIKFITYNFCGIDIENYNLDESVAGNYILFVNAGRSEKNFIRALIAFGKSDAVKNNQLSLVATGLSDKQICKIKKSGYVDPSLYNKNVALKGYVDPDELHALYRSCKCLLFTSLNEGMGLPVAEAILCGKPVVASWKSAMPEVLGAVGYYVNPKSIDSIVKGINYIIVEENYNKKVQYVKQKADILKQQVVLDQAVMADELLH